ncbi:MAG: RNA 2',3'-cyclic phosphodiesterase [Armatimonadetes bacterium]|nr:RNA 2',3'-cyclic phosphodiesterase [Armatimonadota bacterium]
MSESLRCFVAVKIPEAAAARVREAQERLREAEPSWKWVDPDTFHLTLKFLGQVSSDRLGELWSAITASLDGRHSFVMTLKGLGAFPNARSPRVAWAGIQEGAQELGELAEAVETACERLDFEREQRPFAAHLTLGRARRGQTKSQVGQAIEREGDIEFGEAPVERVLLMQSQLRPDGARYTILEEHELEHGEAE